MVAASYGGGGRGHDRPRGGVRKDMYDRPGAVLAASTERAVPVVPCSAWPAPIGYNQGSSSPHAQASFSEFPIGGVGFCAKESGFHFPTGLGGERLCPGHGTSAF